MKVCLVFAISSKRPKRVGSMTTLEMTTRNYVARLKRNKKINEIFFNCVVHPNAILAI